MDAIVAVDARWGIGRDGGLLFRISADLRRFKVLTMGHTVVMGRRTLQSLPGGRGLPGRRNLVLSRQGDLAPEGAEVFHEVQPMLDAAGEDAFVIGGAQVYRLLLPACRRLYVTQIDADGGRTCSSRSLRRSCGASRSSPRGRRSRVCGIAM